jgi:hypothetical protein
VPPSTDEMLSSTSEDIAPTCPYEDSTPGTGAAAEVAYTTLVDHHTVSSEGIEDRMPDLFPWGRLPPVKHLGRLEDVHVALLPLAERPLSDVLRLPLVLEGTVDASLLADSLK